MEDDNQLSPRGEATLDCGSLLPRSRQAACCLAQTRNSGQEIQHALTRQLDWDCG